MLHHIQRSIIERLGFHDSLRYTDLKPAELDGNVFGYHLKHVMRDNYVNKLDDGTYSLTAKGRDYFIHRFEDPTKSAHSIFLTVIKNGDDYLLRRRKVQPLIGMAGFIHGEPTPEIPLLQVANRRVYEKTGLDVDLTFKATVMISQYLEKELISYSHAIILYGETNGTLHIESDGTGDNFWTSNLAANDTLPSCSDIVRIIASGEPWAELTYTI